MDIRIGIINSPREINFESSQTAQEVETIVATALETDTKFVKLVDSKGKLYLVPVSGIGYIEIGSESTRRVGFVA
ncbi:hypothetical protein GCM10027413_25610 [Conyzicola nivalis]|uniref:DUF3107 domain-containing protein n=1 Tax=Conyzicola nivalis TaxID=1477021 RepID=A0A916WE12_9MICO|nr:DUF3107 domain-containing protein [Conyzicola nivalis]GGA90111.1 hypothetical protein GCM10010979_01000 [Conyzicola nivalis]